ncbi:MAG: hypothetical protein GYB30_09050 [Gammaproteobacteria bacterium]|jgi:hypothetical protein|nr:hypothetical protein [Gammaproteobacteria bacterium]
MWRTLVLGVVLGSSLGLGHAANYPNALIADALSPLGAKLPQQQCGVLQATHIVLPQQSQQQPLTMLQGWHQHPLAPFLNCFSLATYSLEQLACSQQGERGRAHCQLPQKRGEPATREIIFVPDQMGIAFNNSQRVVLPVSASMGLFAHEIAHWLGFADEYPMAKELAQNFCTGRYSHASLNIVVTNTEVVSEAELIALWQRLPWRHAVGNWRDLATPTANGYWRLGTVNAEQAEPPVGLYRAQTCDATSSFAWRPVNKFTPMQYYDVTTWPQIYLELVQRGY